MNESMVFNSDCLEVSYKTNQSPGKLELTDLPRGILFYPGRPGILQSSPCMDIKWNIPIYFRSDSKCLSAASAPFQILEERKAKRKGRWGTENCKAFGIMPLKKA